MSSVLSEADIQTLHELLGVIYATESEDDAVQEALTSMKSMMQLDEATSADEDQEAVEDTGSRDKAISVKKHILTVKPDFFEHIIKLPEDPEAEVDLYLTSSKAELIAEMLRGCPQAKLAFIPLVDSLLRSSFRDSSDKYSADCARDEFTRSAVAELLRSDPAANVNHAVQESLSRHIHSFSDVLAPGLLADGMTLELAKRQCALASGLSNITGVPLKSDAVLAFIRAKGLDALLAIIFRGSFSASVPDLESPDEGLEHACCALYRLMVDSACQELTQGLVERQAVSQLFEKMAYICGLECVYSASSVPGSLAVLSKSDDALREQVITQARSILSSNPDDLGPGAAVVLWKLVRAGEEYEIEELESITKSKKYVSFFLTASKYGASDDALDAIGDALGTLVGRPGDQLRRGISTPEQIERFMILVEHACAQSAADISSTIQVLRELILPTDPNAVGGGFNPDEDAKRVDKKFCKGFGVAIKRRYEAAQALAPQGLEDGASVEEPSEEGLANMKNVRMLSTIVDEQYSATALIAEGLLDYLQYLIFNPGPLSRRAGIELLTALTHNSSLSCDFAYVPDLIEGFKGIVLVLLDDPRAVIRALATQWLTRIMSYRHPKGHTMNRYKPSIDFVTESVTEEKLAEMLKGTENEVTATAEMIETMSRHSKGSEVRDRLKKNQDIVNGLWDGVFWDSEKAPEDKDEDISDDVYIYGNIRTSCGEALSQLLDPFSDRASIVERITPRVAEFKEKESYEFSQALTDLPAIASFAVMASETGVLSKIGEMISDEEQLPYAMSALRHLSQGVIMAKASLGQSDDIYPALVKVLQGSEQSPKEIVTDDLGWLLAGSTVTKAKFLGSGGIKPLLGVIALDDDSVSRRATSSLIALITDFPEGAQAAIEAGAIAVLEAKDDSSDIFQRVASALELLKTHKDVSPVDRIDFTPEAYAAFGKTLSEPGAMDKLIQNLKSSGDEKQLAIAGGLLSVFADMLRSSSDPMPVLEVLHTIYVADGVIVSGLNPAAMAGQACGLPDALEPLMESEDDKIKEYATAVRSAVLMEQDDKLDEDEPEEQDEPEPEEEEEPEEDPEEVD